MCLYFLQNTDAVLARLKQALLAINLIGKLLLLNKALAPAIAGYLLDPQPQLVPWLVPSFQQQ